MKPLFETSRFHNVLVVGQTQQGKSSFISKLRELAECTGRGPKIGLGGRSMTVDCDIYELSLSTTDYKLIGKQGEIFMPQLPKDEVDLYEQFARDKNLTIKAVDEFAPHVKLRLIDTPGLDDSEGRDAEHMEKVLHMLSQYGRHKDPSYQYISGIMFVTKMQTPYNAIMQRIFKYYAQCMPNLFRGAAIINTNFHAGDWETKVDEYEQRPSQTFGLGGRRTPRTDLIESRLHAFTEQFEHYRPQFFIDSRPSKIFPFEEFLTKVVVLEWLQYIKKQNDMPIKEIRLYKFPAWKGIDSALIDWLGTAKSKFEEEKERHLRVASQSEKARAISTRRIEEASAEIAEIDERLSVVNVETPFILKQLETSQSSIWGKTKGTIGGREGKIETTHKDVRNFLVDVYPSETGQWVKYGLDEETMTWTGIYRANRWADANLKAKAWATSKDYYAKEIDQLQRKRTALEEMRREEEWLVDHRETTTAPTDHDADIEVLTKFIVDCQVVARKLKSNDVSLGDKSNKAAMQRYRLKDKTHLTVEHLYRVAKPYNVTLARKLGTMGSLFPSSTSGAGIVFDDSDSESDSASVYGVQQSDPVSEKKGLPTESPQPKRPPTPQNIEPEALLQQLREQLKEQARDEKASGPREIANPLIPKDLQTPEKAAPEVTVKSKCCVIL
jgi:hypothetical protein